MDVSSPSDDSRGRSRPLEPTPAERRSALGDTLRQQDLDIMRKPLDATGRGRPAETTEGNPGEGFGELGELIREAGSKEGFDDESSPEPDAADRGRARAVESTPGRAARRAAPGDTLREELEQMRIGADATAVSDPLANRGTIRLDVRLDTDRGRK
mmetsp:Transcript_111167/g.192757  ORF Transcript_111167/g.192757 Transcript_111167/m.192757 type:complete len:156 (+) Transcript_111167:98-565(+)